MKENTHNIAKLIAQYFLGDLEHSRKTNLVNYLATNPEEWKLIKEKLQDKLIQKDLEEILNFEESKDWKIIESNLSRNHQSKGLIKHFIVLSTFLILVIYILYYLLKPIFQIQNSLNENIVDQTIINQVANEPVSAILAQLTLSNGQQIPLYNSIQILKNGQFQSKDLKTKGYLPDQKRQIWNTLQVPKSNTYLLELEDGSKIWLNANSVLEFPNTFSKNDRHIKLTGEAFFEIYPGLNRPFIVETTNGNIEAFGTKFHVFVNENRFVSSLLEGSIQMKTRIGTYILQPNQQAIIEQNKIFVRKADFLKTLDWIYNRFLFKNDSLDQIMEDLEKWYQVQVIWKTQNHKNLKFSGEISRKGTLSEVLKIISQSTRLSFRLVGNHLIIE